MRHHNVYVVIDDVLPLVTLRCICPRVTAHFASVPDSQIA